MCILSRLDKIICKRIEWRGKMNKDSINLPAIPLRGITIFPNMIIHFDVIIFLKGLNYIHVNRIPFSIYAHPREETVHLQ